MKIIPILFLLLLTSCIAAPPMPSYVYTPPLTPLELYSDEVKSADRRNMLILITDISTSMPNSANGVDVHIDFLSLSKSPIKYATFYVVPYNAVKDKVASEIGNNVEAKLTSTGPYFRGATNGGKYWDNVWYNSTIVCAVIESIEITLMDGTIKKYLNKDLGDVFVNSYNKSYVNTINTRQQNCRS